MYMEEDMKLEVGKYYKTRDGRKVGPLGGGRGAWHKFTCPLFSYGDNGRLYSTGEQSPNDLIAEWTDAPTTGTLSEIGAQVGDVVEYIATACIYTVHDDMHLENSEGDMIEYSGCWTVNGGVFRIVSRAADYQPDENECIEAAMAKGIDYPAQPQGPVITETVKRIVPGVYGSIRIDECASPNYISIELDDDVFNKDEIRAMIATLTQLIDAMPDNA